MKLFHLIVTGGTIDSYYHIDQCGAVCLEHTTLPTILVNDAHVKPSSFTVEEVCMKDGRDISDVDRQKMIEAIDKTECRSIILTHGSFTVFETGRYLEQNLSKDHGKTIVLTGSLIPIKGFVNSDGLFNLGASIVASQTAASGVYVCIEGALFRPTDKDVWH